MLASAGKKPYYIENIRMNIYSPGGAVLLSVGNNACPIDESLLNERLLDWLRDELDRPDCTGSCAISWRKKTGSDFL
ncbi:MAG: hypothetical protein ACLTSZ_08525 [Lachnospiraceae bacterium]